MPRILVGKSFARKYVPEMSAACRTGYFDASAVGVGSSFYSPCDLVVETGPTATGMEFILRTVERGAALPAVVYAFTRKIGILPGERWLGAFVYDNMFFERGEFFCHIFARICSAAGIGVIVSANVIIYFRIPQIKYRIFRISSQTTAFTFTNRIFHIRKQLFQSRSFGQYRVWNTELFIYLC